MFKNSIDEIVHILLAIHAQGSEFYLSQIEELIEHFGNRNVLEAENRLYDSRIFHIISN